jgi:Na+-transporting methylmalonyl-CoA/oxaloacetate decarboxylase beta subunit
MIFVAVSPLSEGSNKTCGGVTMNVGIIGGADGPTSITIASTLNPLVLVGVVVVAVAIIGFILWRRARNKE